MTEYNDTAHNSSVKIATAPDPSSGPPELSEHGTLKSFAEEMDSRFGLTGRYRLSRYDSWGSPIIYNMPTKVHVPRSMSRSGTGERRREAVLGEIINTSRAITEAKSSSFASMDESKLNKMEKYKDDLIWRMYGLTMQYGVDHGIKFIQDKLDEYTKLGGRRDPVSVLEDFDTLRQPMKNLYRRHIEKVIGSLRDQEDNADIDESTEDIRKRRRKYDQDWLLRSKAWCDVDESSITFILEGWDDLDNSGPALRTNFTFIGLVFPHESSLSPNTYLSGA